MKLLTKRFGDEFSITPHAKDGSDNSSAESFILKPKDNPSLVKATIFPMYKTRYKFKVTFLGDDSDDMTFEDMYAITFNRTNGATPEQQERIRERTQKVQDELYRLREELRYDREKK